MTSRAVLALWLVAGAAAGACADLERGPRPQPAEAGSSDGGTADGARISFASVRPLLTEGCAQCHAAGGQAGTSSFLLGGDEAADYRSARALIDLDKPAASRLLAKAAGQGHGGGTVWSTAAPESTAILAWIRSGGHP